MNTVMIVDDEPLIREGLQTLIDWQAYGYTVVCSAKNGSEALEYYHKKRPDLIIIDIRMPVKSGLEVIKHIRLNDVDTQFIILTGHADFQYAKQALSSKVAGYLLKPLEEEELILLLKGIKTEWLKQEDWLQFKREELLQRLLSSDYNRMKKEDISRQWEHYRLSANSYQLFVTTLDASYKESFAQLAIPFMHPSVIERRVVILCLNPNQQDMAKLAFQLKELGGYGAMTLPVFQVWELIHAYDQALSLLDKSFLFEEGTVFDGTSNEENSEQELESEVYEQDIVYHLLLGISLGDKATIQPIINQLKSRIVKQGLDASQIKLQVAHVYSLLITQLNESRSNTKDQAMGTKQLLASNNLSMLFQEFEQLIDSELEYESLKGKGNVIRKIIKIMESQFNQSLKLEELAAHAHYNRTYLGTLFKEYTGEYYNTYLDKIRISHAKKFLQEGHKVYEVSEKVGYKDVDYFHRKFKKYVGISPKGFQKTTLS